MATFLPICGLCSTPVEKVEGHSETFWVHSQAAKCSGPYYVKLEKPLNEVMEFDSVVRVSGKGTVHNVPLLSPYIDMHIYKGDDGQWHDNFELADGWNVESGFSNQQSYSGPVMHSSEFIGGGLETHILETPGYWMAVVVESDCGYTEEGCTEESGCDCEPAGWALVHKEFTATAQDGE